MLLFCCDLDLSLDERNHLPLSIGVMLDISGSGAEACVSSQHLDIPQAAADLVFWFATMAFVFGIIIGIVG